MANGSVRMVCVESLFTGAWRGAHETAVTSTNNLQFEFDILIDPKGSLLILGSSIFKLLLQGSLKIVGVIKSPSASNSTEQNVSINLI